MLPLLHEKRAECNLESDARYATHEWPITIRGA
jgi:hypothetical protein